jgi:hypothetical protein
VALTETLDDAGSLVLVATPPCRRPITHGVRLLSARGLRSSGVSGRLRVPASLDLSHSRPLALPHNAHGIRDSCPPNWDRLTTSLPLPIDGHPQGIGTRQSISPNPILQLRLCHSPTQSSLGEFGRLLPYSVPQGTGRCWSFPFRLVCAVNGALPFKTPFPLPPRFPYSLSLFAWL